MKINSIPELAQLPEPERRKVLASASAGVFRDPRVWGAYAAQGLGFVLLFFVFFPTAQPRLLLILVYALPTAWLVSVLHQRVVRERVIAVLKQ